MDTQTVHRFFYLVKSKKEKNSAAPFFLTIYSTCTFVILWDIHKALSQTQLQPDAQGEGRMETSRHCLSDQRERVCLESHSFRPSVNWLPASRTSALCISHKIPFALMTNNKTHAHTTYMNVLIFIFGAFAYYTIEILFRGYSHWSMALTGGACLLAFSWFIKQNPQFNIVTKAVVGAVIITVYEFFVGLVVNIWYGWQVWDYGNEPWNLIGIICLRFTVVWFLLCLIALFIFQKGCLLYEYLCRIIKDRAYLNKRRQI